MNSSSSPAVTGGVYNPRMPISSLVSAIVSSVIGTATDQPAQAPAAPASTAINVSRSIPADTLFGEMAPPTFGTVLINGVSMPLAMAAQFRNELDRPVMPGTIRQPVKVRYLVDSTGTVYRVWILSPAELAASGVR